MHFFTHFGNINVKVGDTVLPGVPLGTVWDGQGVMAPHIHWGTTQGDPVQAGYINPDGTILNSGQSSGFGSTIKNIFGKIIGGELLQGPFPGQDPSGVPGDLAGEVLGILKDYLFGDVKAWGLRLAEIIGGAILVMIGLSKITGIGIPKPPMLEG